MDTIPVRDIVENMDNLFGFLLAPVCLNKQTGAFYIKTPALFLKELVPFYLRNRNFFIIFFAAS